MRRLRWLVTGGVVIATGIVVRVLLSPKIAAVPIEATVVEARTGKPLSGVVVVARWEREDGLVEARRRGLVMVTEGITDATGTFRMPGWGPIRVWGVFPEVGPLNPRSYAFKWGYARWLHANDPAGASDVITRRASIDGTPIQLEPVSTVPDSPGTSSQALVEFRRFAFDMMVLFQYSTCDWRRTPRIWAELAPILEREDVQTRDNFEAAAKAQGCGSFLEFMRALR